MRLYINIMIYNVTTRALHDWTKAEFEKLGWMVLANRDHHKYKIDGYKMGLNHLKEALEQKIGKTQEEDRRNDLMILHRNLECLIGTVNKMFKTHHRK